MLTETWITRPTAAIPDMDQDMVTQLGLPAGNYLIGRPFHSAQTGPGAMRLTPVGGVNPYSRKDLEIHGDKAPYNHTASTGCIIEGPAVRQKIAQSLDQDNCLQVVP
jgi:hypothetical protein